LASKGVRTMDVFKLAFETVIVGLLTFPWLGLATYLLFPDLVIDLVTRQIPALVKDNQASLGVAVLTLAYCLGSAILPIGNQLVNDEHWPLNENAIRCQVFTQQETELELINYSAVPKGLKLENLTPDHCSYWAPVFYPTNTEKQTKVKRFRGIWRLGRLWIGHTATSEDDESAPNKRKTTKELEAKCDKKVNEGEGRECDKFKAGKILRLFDQEETTVLNQNSDTTEQLRQLHERIVVLRGAVFSGFIVLLICLFAYFARVYGQPLHWMRSVCGSLLALSFGVFAMFNGINDLNPPHIFDIPVLETLLLVNIIFGFLLVFRGVKTQLFRTKRCVLIAIFFTGLTYGGWMWSEIIYDQQVISSFAVLQGSAVPVEK
jgi:hypothetical protein